MDRSLLSPIREYFYSNNDPTSPKAPKKQTTEPILGTALLGKKVTKKVEKSLLDFSPRIPLGTFSILLTTGWMGKRGLAYCQLGFIGK